MDFKLKSKFKPTGSQPEAIKKLVQGLKDGENFQTLLGVTGSGKTFSVANVIEKYNRPTLVLAHNKTLAGQLYNELKELFPDNRVEYFVSYYDYYKPESYIPQRDLFIEKDSQVNAKLEQMRMATTASLFSRNDTIVVASISCIYGLGNPENYKNLGFNIDVGQTIERKKFMKKLVSIQYERNDTELLPGKFRVKGNTIDLIPAHYHNIIRFEFFGDEIDSIKEIDKMTGDELDNFNYYFVYPASHFTIPDSVLKRATAEIEEELENSVAPLGEIEAHRLRQRTTYDLEMIRETGFCKGVENYSLHFDGRKKGEAPYCLLDYFPEDFLFIIDESHQSIPQSHGMYKGDYARKKNLIDYGFRLQTAYDNRPLKFEEFEKYLLNKKTKVICVSATPGKYELEHSNNVVEQIIRPTGLVDPIISVRKTKNQMYNLMDEILTNIKEGKRVLITTITKKLAEELSEFLSKKGIKTRYLHSEIETLERSEIIRELRLGKFDVLVGINLLREGIDIPEVGLVGILDTDKEGFLRDTKSLIQIIGRAARNAEAKVVMYADRMTDSMKFAIEETERRRLIQLRYNKENNITPKTIIKAIKEKEIEIKDTKHIPKAELKSYLEETKKEMDLAAENLEFEKAILLRDKVNLLEKRIKEKDNKK